MKDLGIYFSPFDLSPVEKDDNLSALVIPTISERSESKSCVAIFSVPEFRNSTNNKSTHSNRDIIESLVKLYPHNWEIDLLILGEIIPGESVQDTFGAVQDVVTELVKNEIVPFLIGGSQDLTYAMYTAYEFLEQTVNIVDFNPHPDLGDLEEEISSDGWLAKVIGHKPSYLFNYSLIGYQTYLSSQRELDLLNQLYFDYERLGNFYGNGGKIEPLVRNADILSFDMDVIRGSDYPNNSKNLPHGFYGEDACKVMRYAGMSDKLTSAGIYFNSLEKDAASINLSAQLIWHFIEGVANRKKDYPIGSKEHYIKYRVSIDEFKDEIIFHKSPNSGRWWMEVPYPKSERLKFQRHLLVPCNYEDYENAQKNEMPDLWWRTHQKLI